MIFSSLHYIYIYIYIYIYLKFEYIYIYKICINWKNVKHVLKKIGVKFLNLDNVRI